MEQSRMTNDATPSSSAYPVRAHMAIAGVLGILGMATFFAYGLTPVTQRPANFSIVMRAAFSMGVASLLLFFMVVPAEWLVDKHLSA